MSPTAANNASMKSVNAAAINEASSECACLAKQQLTEREHNRGSADVCQQVLTGERAMFRAANQRIVDSTFADGESPLKHAHDLELVGSMFKWKYPLWYCENIVVKDSTWFEMARAGVWYTKNITVENSIVEAPKNFRRADGVHLNGVQFPNAAETLWNCRNITMHDVTAKGDYFAMNCENVTIDGFTLVGNYSFDGARNVEVHNARMLSKDAFWNAENITVYDSFISGEYFGWNSKNITLVNCTIESLQGMCYIDNLVMRDCRLLNTTLAFEYSTVDAQINGSIDSVLNPSGGVIRADHIGELTMNPNEVDVTATRIECDAVDSRRDTTPSSF